MWAGMPGALASDAQAFSVFQACLDHHLTLFDTAEMYGSGASEERLGHCIRKYGGKVLIADKFAPPSDIIPSPPKRKIYDPKSPLALMEALDGSLMRLGTDVIDLYQMHAPPKYHTIAAYMDVMAEAYRQGKIRAVSDFCDGEVQSSSSGTGNRRCDAGMSCGRYPSYPVCTAGRRNPDGKVPPWQKTSHRLCCSDISGSSRHHGQSKPKAQPAGKNLFQTSGNGSEKAGKPVCMHGSDGCEV